MIPHKIREKSRLILGVILIFFTISIVCLSQVSVATELLAERGEEPRAYSISTATISGTYFPVMSAMASVVSDHLAEKGIMFVAIKSEGSQQNVQHLQAEKVDFAILQGLTAYQAWTGTGPFAETGRFEELRSVMNLWPDVEQFFIKKDHAKSGTMDDLKLVKGRAVAFGHLGSGTRQTSLLILDALGFSLSDDFVNRDDLQYSGAIDALVDGEIDAVAAPGGVPVSAVRRAFARVDAGIVMLSFTGEQAALVNKTAPIWSPATIESSVYEPGMRDPVQSISQPTLLVTRSDMPDDAVYEFLAAVFEPANLAKLRTVHAVIEHLDQSTSDPATNTDDFPPPHPAATRFFSRSADNN